jgi:acylphosphatase
MPVDPLDLLFARANRRHIRELVVAGRTIVSHGRVQGVGYRAWVEYQATNCGLEGWVRNRRDGSVEALLTGDEAAVAEMLRACWRGPPHADVADIAEHPAEPPGEPGFRRQATQ